MASDASIFILYALGAAFMNGTSKIVTRKGMLLVEAPIGVFVNILAGLVVIAVYSLSIGAFGDLGRVDWWLFVALGLAGITNFSIGRLLVYSSIKSIGATRATQITVGQIVFSALFAMSFLNERMTVNLAIGSALILGGVIVVTRSEPTATQKVFASGAAFVKGVALALLGALAWGAASILQRSGVTALGSPALATLIGLLCAAPAQGIIVTMTPRSPEQGDTVGTGIRYMILSGIMTALGSLSLYTAYDLAPVVKVVPISKLEPLFTIVASYIMIQKIELIDLKLVLSCLMVVFGSYIVTALG